MRQGVETIASHMQHGLGFTAGCVTLHERTRFAMEASKLLDITNIRGDLRGLCVVEMCRITGVKSGRDGLAPASGATWLSGDSARCDEA